MQKSRKVLVITYYWPPAGGPGVQRVLKFVKYLPEFGWEPVVMTVKNGDFPALDPTLENEIPKNLKIYKIPITEPYKLYRRLTGKHKSESVPVALLAQKEGLTKKQRTMNWIRTNLVIPDARIGWYRNAVNAGQKIIKKENIALIFVSSPPHSLQLIALKLKRLSGLPLVSDYRDPWTLIHYYQNLKRWKLTSKFDQYLEKRSLEKTDLLITVSGALEHQFRELAKIKKSIVIYNGFDFADFFDLPPQPFPAKFILAYIGNLSSIQNSEGLWQSLQELCRDIPGFSENLRVELTGTSNPETELSIDKFKLRNNYFKHEYVPHNQAITAMRTSAVLIFIIPDAPKNEGILTGKLFEYLAVSKPLLSIGPVKGDAAKILAATKAGPMFEFEDITGIKQRLNELYLAWQRQDLTAFFPDKELILQFDRCKLTGKLSQCFEELISSQKKIDNNRPLQ